MRHPLRCLAAVTLTATAFLSPPGAHAASSVQQVAITCSGNLNTSDVNGFSLQCDGNLGLNGLDVTARIWSDGEISLRATGDLILNRLLLDAPSYTFTAGNSVLVASDVKLPSPIPVTSGVVVHIDNGLGGRVVAVPDLGTQGSITLQTSTVPEPGTLVLSALGLATLFVARQRKAA